MISRIRMRKLSLAAAICAFAAAVAAAPQAARSAPAMSAALTVPQAATTTAASLIQNARRQELEQAVLGWIEALSAQTPFLEWKQAVPSIEALGPGTHGWLVTMRLASGKPVGYMVVYAAEDGTYRLGEYGAGPQPLFDAATLSRTLVANGLVSGSTAAFKAEKLYLHPFAAVWKVRVNEKTYWLDAKTGEMLPLDDEQWDMLDQTFSQGDPSLASPVPPDDKGTIAAIRVNAAFDPFERLSWLMNEKPFGVQDERSLLSWLDRNKQLRFTSEPFGDRMRYVLAVIGYERWSDGRIDVALDNEGVRFIPLTALRASGLFYK